MEAIILAGGMGTRLRSVISELPKPMAPIGDTPFLTFLLEYLNRYGVNRVILATGYRHEMISAYYGSNYKNIFIEYSIESEPLGTGGAIKRALDRIGDDHVYLLNGDTLFYVDLDQLMKVHVTNHAHVTLSLKPMNDFNRYGAVELSGSKIAKFHEKKYVREGLINGGVYLLDSTVFDGLALGDKFSIENDFLEKHIHLIDMYSYISDSYFIDIGIPEDYHRACRELVLGK